MRSVWIFLFGMSLYGADPFTEAAECKLCHTNLPRPAEAKAVVTPAPERVGQYPLWAGSMMAHAAKDPYWKAKVKFEGDTTPAARAEIEDKCLRCHAPMQQYPLRGEGKLMRMADLNANGAEGVSCTVCHKITPEGLGTAASFTGGFRINTENAIYGPHQDPFPMPMRMHTNDMPEYGKQILDAALCGSCHTVITPTLDANGKQTGEFVEQAPYLEWKASDYAKSNITCQSCHVPVLEDAGGNKVGQYIAHSPHDWFFPRTRPRTPFGQHLFLGGNVQMMRVMGGELAASAERTEGFLRGGLTMEATGRMEGERIALAVELKNKTGHKLPTGFPSRRMWVHVEVRDAAGAVVFASGGWDRRTGELTGASARQPHRDVITRGHEVAIYEAEMQTPDGRPTISLMRASGYGKDNRLLPLGFRATPEIAPVGVKGDPDFVAGGDRVRYSIAAASRKGPFRVTVETLFQSVAPRHAEGLDAAFLRQLAPHRAPVRLQQQEITIR
jgi:hypothetical protein